MALGMKHWIGVVCIGLALVAIWLLPPGFFGAGNDEVAPAVQLRHDRLADDFRSSAEALRRVRWADSLSALTLATAEAGVAFALPPGRAEDRALERRLEAHVRTRVESVTGGRPAMLFGYVHQPYDHGRTPDMPFGARRRTETYVGARDGAEYCLQVRVRSSWGATETVLLGEVEGTSGVAPVSDALGACRYYLRHGMPGPGVQQWLEAGGVAFAIEKGAKPGLPEEFERALRRASAFGRSPLVGRNRPIEIDQCRAGDADACATVFLRPGLLFPPESRELDVTSRSPALSLGGRASSAALTEDGAYLLGDLEDEFGPEAFAGFWRSEAPVGEAFEEAFGAPPGRWVRDWVARVDRTPHSSPALPRSASSGGLLTVALLLGIAYARNRRRAVT